VKSAKSFVNAPNLLTAGRLAVGFVALILAGRQELVWAAGMTVAAVVVDTVDGAVARRLGLCTPFGCQLDALADIVSFGAAPALMLQAGVLGAIPVAGVGACLAFLLCGSWRLARFPLIEEPHRILGLPIPVAGLIAAVVAAWAPPSGFALAMTLAMAALMVSEVPFPTLRTLWQLRGLRGRAVQSR
jgi:CDP-diacylglycerol--serine O-phosphatidyltransferase